MAFLLCVGCRDYDGMRKVSSSVVCPLTGRYTFPQVLSHTYKISVGKNENKIIKSHKFQKHQR